MTVKKILISSYLPNKLYVSTHINNLPILIFVKFFIIKAFVDHEKAIPILN